MTNVHNASQATRIKLCGLSRESDIEAVNELRPEYIGFVFWPKSKRYVPVERAESLRKMLASDIQAVGVFVDEVPEVITSLTEHGVIDIVQLHGHEDDDYISRIKSLTHKPIIKAFKIATPNDASRAQASTADYIMLDAGKGTGILFDWRLIRGITRPYFLAGGLTVENVGDAVRELHPFAVDVSSGIETGGFKDKAKMAAFVDAVREI